MERETNFHGNLTFLRKYNCNVCFFFSLLVLSVLAIIGFGVRYFLKHLGILIFIALLVSLQHNSMHISSCNKNNRRVHYIVSLLFLKCWVDLFVVENSTAKATVTLHMVHNLLVYFILKFPYNLVVEESTQVTNKMFSAII